MATKTMAEPLVALFGYDSSPFTQKARLALQLKQIPYTFVIVPSMMPRPLLKESFNVTYRKIPILVIGKEIYIDTSLILEALEHHFPPSAGYGTIYPLASNGRTNRSLIRGFTSYWIDRPFFRVTTGLIPSTVWRTSFGTDRANLIGHILDPDKLEKKVPQNLSNLDLQLSLLEPMLADATEKHPWMFDTETPSAADIAFFYQLDWGEKISRGDGIRNLTAGGASDGVEEGMSQVFNQNRYPNIWKWFARAKKFFDELPKVETRIEGDDAEGIQSLMKQIKKITGAAEAPMLGTTAPQHKSLDERNGLVKGENVSIAPDDTGRGDPTIGSLVALSPEEVVIVPETIDGKAPAVGNVRVHFPRIGFVVRPLNGPAMKAKF